MTLQLRLKAPPRDQLHALPARGDPKWIVIDENGALSPSWMRL